MGPQAHQGLGGLDPELGDQHAGGLADLHPAKRFEVRPRHCSRIIDGGLQVSVHQVQQGDAGQFSGRDGTD